MEKRVISTQVMQEDIPVEAALRPKTLDEYVGQEKAKENLRVYIEAAKKRGEALAHSHVRWIMCSFTDLPDWGRRRWRALLPMRWACT